MNPPRTAKTPFPVTLPPRSYPRSVRRRTKRIGDNTRSVSIKNAFSLHHVCVFTAFFMERAFSENHNSPRSRFWGVREAIRSSFVSGGAGVFILYGCILSQMREKFKKCHGERIRHPGGVFGKKFKIHELYVFIARSGFSETAISTALIVRLMIFAIARFSSGVHFRRTIFSAGISRFQPMPIRKRQNSRVFKARITDSTPLCPAECFPKESFADPAKISASSCIAKNSFGFTL